MLPTPRLLLERALCLLFPDRCLGCARLGALLCAGCRRRLKPYPGPTRALPPLAASQVGYVFEGPLRAAAHRLKYQGQRRVAGLLAELLAEGLDRRALQVDALVPVPLSSARLVERGYNQSELIARDLARHLGLPLLAQGLVRVRATRSQVGLDSLARHANVADAFAWRGSPPPARILLVDDILTTGATLQACATALIHAGSTRVVATAVARSRPDIDRAALALNRTLAKL
jgi:ComF family protein